MRYRLVRHTWEGTTIPPRSAVGNSCSISNRIALKHMMCPVNSLAARRPLVWHIPVHSQQRTRCLTWHLPTMYLVSTQFSGDCLFVYRRLHAKLNIDLDATQMISVIPWQQTYFDEITLPLGCPPLDSGNPCIKWGQNLNWAFPPRGKLKRIQTSLT
jgi:hypothetical protein